MMLPGPSETADRAALARNFRAARAQRGWTQAEAARAAADFAGLPWTRPTVASLESGRREMSLPEAILLHLMVGISFQELLDP